MGAIKGAQSPSNQSGYDNHLAIYIRLFYCNYHETFWCMPQQPLSHHQNIALQQLDFFQSHWNCCVLLVWYLVPLQWYCCVLLVWYHCKNSPSSGDPILSPNNATASISMFVHPLFLYCTLVFDWLLVISRLDYFPASWWSFSMMRFSNRILKTGLRRLLILIG